MYCLKCASEIEPEDIDTKEGFAICRKCGNIIKIRGGKIPKGISVREDYSGLIIERRWYSIASFFVLLFTLF